MCFFILNLPIGVHMGKNIRQISIRKFKRKTLINWAGDISYFQTIKSMTYFPCAANNLGDLSAGGRPNLLKRPQSWELPKLKCKDGWDSRQTMQNVLQEAFKVQINSCIMSVIIKVACLALYTISHAFHKLYFSIFLEDYNENSFLILKHILVDGYNCFIRPCNVAAGLFNYTF